MRCSRFARGGAVLVVAGGIGLAGCGTNITPDMTIREVVNQIDLFNQITVGDLIAAFQQFTAGGPFGDGRRMTDEQAAALVALQAQFDAGEITADQFAEQVQAVIGDGAPGMAFGAFEFFGGPFRHGFGGAFGPGFGGWRAALLNLTDEQRQQAADIFERLHDDVHALRTDAHERMRAVLTEEQLAQLDALGPRPWARFGFGFGPHGHGGAAGDMAGARGRPGHRGAVRFGERLADYLNLTEEQRAQIETIRQELREAVQARHQQAREEFLAILTEAQRIILDALENPAPDQPADAAAAA